MIGKRKSMRIPGLHRDNFVALLDQGVVSVANFFTGLIVGRICAKEQFGLYMLGFTVITMAMTVQDSLLLTPYTIQSPRLKGVALSRYKASTFLHQLLFSACILFFLILFRFALHLGAGPSGMAPVVEALIFVVGFILLRNYARRVCFAALKIGEALALDVLVSVLQIGGLVTLAYLDSLAASRAYWVIGVASFLGTLPWMWSKKKEFTFTRGNAAADLKQNFSAGIWILASGLLWTMVISLYPWLLATFHGTATTGVWAACVGIIAFCNPLFLTMQNSFGPKIAHAFARDGGDALRGYSMQVTKIFGGVLVPFCIALLVFGGDLVAAVYGSKYTGTGAIVAILAVDFFFAALSFPLSRALFTIGRADIDFKINLLMLLCLLFFGVLLVKRLGAPGAAISLLLTSSICFVSRYIAFRRIAPMDREKSLLPPELLRGSVTETK
jgi:O-antigen/teichoic acid export membrane protein